MGQEREPSSQAAADSGPETASEARRAAQRLAGSFGFEEIAPEEKSGRVARVFDTVADRYDIMNDLMSLGVHRLWKEALVDWLAPRRGRRYLDLAGGTGDVAERILERVDGEASVTLADINEAMLARGRDRAIEGGHYSAQRWIVADAQMLPFSSRSFDVCTIAFGIRNVTDIERALREMHRVLQPGGRMLCLEFSQLTIRGLRQLYDRYSFTVLPTLGRLVAGDAASYRYLAESIRRFPNQSAFAELMREAGFEQVRYRNLSGGIAAIHSGWRL